MKLFNGKFRLSLIIIILLSLIFTYGLPWMFSFQCGKAVSRISIAFKGAGNGLDPQGNRFDIYEIKKDEILNEAIVKSDLENKVSVDQLKTRIEILPEADSDTLKELVTLTKIRGKTQDIKERMVYPTSFQINLKDMGLPSYFTDKKLLKNILGAYREYMEKKYLSNIAAEPVYSKEEILNLDYPEMMMVLNQEAEGLLRYIEFFKENEPQYVSENKGLSFNDMYQQASLLKDTDIGNMRSLVNYYRLTKNREDRIKYDETLLKRTALVANKLNGSELAVADIVNIYDNSNNFIFASSDASTLDLKPAENLYYSDLMNSLVKKQTAYIEAKYNQQDILLDIEKLQNGVVSEAEQEKVVLKIGDGTEMVLTKIDKLRKQTEEIAKEFYGKNIDSKILVSDLSYEFNTYGNIFINTAILAAVAILLHLVYPSLRKKSGSLILAIRAGVKKFED